MDYRKGRRAENEGSQQGKGTINSRGKYFCNGRNGPERQEKVMELAHGPKNWGNEWNEGGRNLVGLNGKAEKGKME